MEKSLIERARAVGLLDDLLCDNCEATALEESIEDCGSHIAYECSANVENDPSACRHVSMLSEQIIEEAELAL